MSRVGRKEIQLPAGVEVQVADRTVKVKGPKGELEYRLLHGIEIDQEGGAVQVRQTLEGQQARAFWGLSRSLIANMVEGVSQGYKRGVELKGTGYRAELKGTTLVLHVGYSHPIEYPMPKGVNATIDGARIHFESIDKQLVGQVTSEVRSFRKPEPYNGKGVRYIGEIVKQKAGKTAAG